MKTQIILHVHGKEFPCEVVEEELEITFDEAVEKFKDYFSSTADYKVVNFRVKLANESTLILPDRETINNCVFEIKEIK